MNNNIIDKISQALEQADKELEAYLAWLDYKTNQDYDELNNN